MNFNGMNRRGNLNRTFDSEEKRTVTNTIAFLYSKYTLQRKISINARKENNPLCYS